MTLDELYDVLLMDKPSSILKNRERELFNLIPELEKCRGFDQHSKWHPYDVYEHILHVIDNVPSNLIMRLTALFHDIGKPITYTEDENGVGHFYNHWEVSKKIFNEFANKHNIDENVRESISNLIYYHDINISKLDDDKLKEINNVLGLEGITQLFEFKKADLLAQNEKYNYILDEYEVQKKKMIRLKRDDSNE